MKKRLDFLRDIWKLTKPYWFSEDRWAGLGLLAAIIAMTLALVYLNVRFVIWSRAFWDAIQHYDWHGFWVQLGVFCILAAISIVVQVYASYLQQMLQIRWRRWLTDRFLGHWLTDKTYYDLQMRAGHTDNPDQRIANDIGDFVGQTLNLALGALGSVVTLFSFLTMLWAISGTLTISIAGHALTIPGYMCWLAFIYAAVGTWLTIRVGKPLVGLNFDQQRYEADFRFSLVRLRENVEGVALYGGEDDEKTIFRSLFSNVVGNWWAIMKRTKLLGFLTGSYNQAAVIFPVLAAAPLYFAKAEGFGLGPFRFIFFTAQKFEIGAIQQTLRAFGQVQGALSWVVNSFTGLASWKATVDRLTSFTTAMEEVHAAREVPDALKPAPNAKDELAVTNLELDLPSGDPLLTGITLTVAPGETLLIQGPTGSGKSTLLRAIAGLWPYGRGSVALPQGKTLFLPQKPYLPIGTLRAVVSYPMPPQGFTDEAVTDVLKACGLSHLAKRLDQLSSWYQELSPGEQQRLAFARLLLQAPDFVFLDEATSAMDETSERTMYALLKERLPKAAIISVGHRASLSEFHHKTLSVQADKSDKPGRATLSLSVQAAG